MNNEEQQVRPPLGLEPIWLIKERRLKELNEAMSRYVATATHYPYIWYAEKLEIEQYLKVREIKIGARKITVSIIIAKMAEANSPLYEKIINDSSRFGIQFTALIKFAQKIDEDV